MTEYRFTPTRLWTTWHVLSRLFRERDGHQQAGISEAMRALEGEIRRLGYWNDAEEEETHGGQETIPGNLSKGTEPDLAE